MGTSKREGDILASQMIIQQLQERDQLLSAQNGILKVGNAFEHLPFSHLQLEERLLHFIFYIKFLMNSLVPLLQMEKANLKKKVIELDDMVKALLGTQSTQQRIRPSSMTKVCLNWRHYPRVICT